MDSSGSISRRNFAKIKNFLRSTINNFDIGHDAAQVAIVVYSTNAEVVLRFNDLEGLQLTSDAVIRKVNDLPHQRGFTFINKALRLAETEVFTEANGMRRNVPKVHLFCKKCLLSRSLLSDNNVF